MTIITSLIFFPSGAYAKLENGMDADVVIGQPDFTSNTAATTQRQLSTTRGIFSDGKRLFVVNDGVDRILIWNAIPTVNFAPADVVVGQPNFTSSAAGALSASTFDNVFQAVTDGQRMIVADKDNHRILIWNSVPTTNGSSANVVVGAANFDTATSGTTQRDLNRVFSVCTDGQRLFAAEESNHRVLIWNSIPTSNYALADVVVGQSSFTSALTGVSQRNFNTPLGVASDGKRLFVSDHSNHRILIWNSIPTTNFAPADVVLGQPNFTSNRSGTDQRRLNNPRHLFSDGRRLFVADRGNRRVLVWNEIPTENFTPADVVVGQPNFGTNTAGVTRSKMGRPTGVFADGKRLFIADTDNNRVLIFNISGESGIKLGPQFNQGKAMLGKVFLDLNGNGVQDTDMERGIEGVKVASDTGIYAITDQDGKYHFPFIETGQRILKIDPSTLPEGSKITSESPRKVIVTKGVLTKVSFGVKLPEIAPPGHSEETKPAKDDKPLLKVSASQDSLLLKPSLQMNAKLEKDEVLFTIDCNYFLLIDQSEIALYDGNMKKFKTIPLPKPLPYHYSIKLTELPETPIFYYQLSVFDKEGNEDRTGMGSVNRLMP